MRQNPHVRICGGPGSATTLVYPTARTYDLAPDGRFLMVKESGAGDARRDPPRAVLTRISDFAVVP